jgi:F-type H+-transporting ATPase subunit gamma
MATMKAIKKRISSVKNTQKITYAMYMVSAAKLRRAQMNAENSRPYAEALSKLIGNIVSRVEQPDHPLLVPHPEIKRAELVVGTSDRGLCGGYNSNLIRKAEAFIKENRGRYETIEISTIGKRAADYFKRRKVAVRKSSTNLLRSMNYGFATAIADELTARYVTGEVDAIFLVYARFKSALTQVPTIVPVLPFAIDKQESGGNQVDYIYEPSAKEILSVLLPKQVRTQIYCAMLEAVASEHGARMTAMDSASSNAKEMIDHLTLQYNRARQSAITKELMEIIGGAEALKG